MITKEPQPGERVECIHPDPENPRYVGTVSHCFGGICWMIDETKPEPESQKEFWGWRYDGKVKTNNCFIWQFHDGKMNTMHRIQTIKR